MGSRRSRKGPPSSRVPRWRLNARPARATSPRPPLENQRSPAPQPEETYRRTIFTGKPSLGIANGTNCTGISYPSRTPTR